MGRYVEPRCDAACTPGSVSTSTLPSALVEVSAKRLAAVVFALGLFALSAVVLNVVGPSNFGWSETCAATGATIYGTLVLMSLVFVMALKSGRFSLPTLFNLAFFYEVVYALAISYSEVSAPHAPGTLNRGVSYVVVLIILFPLFVPSSLPKAAVAAIAAACTGPAAALLYSVGTGNPIPPLTDFVWAYLFNYLTVFLALIPTAIMRRLGREVSDAKRLGSYALEKKLGQGGMGEVWRASHNTLKRPAAIKLIRPEVLAGVDCDNATALKRFEREAQTTAGLHSFHTVQVYDFGITEQGTFFYVMELLDGFDMHSLVKTYGPQPAERVVYLLRQACDSLADAHERGLIHRDIKPANLYVCSYGRHKDVTKVLDFGLVKHHDALARGETQLTQGGSTAGTPAYMAPEMATAEQDVDGRADLYALGCVAYWLLTGEQVFAYDHPMKVAVAHVNEPPVPPSQRTELPIPADLERVVLACLAKDPDDRPQSAAELQERLEACELDAPWTTARAQRWWDVHHAATRRPPAKLRGPPTPARKLVPAVGGAAVVATAKAAT